MQATRVRFVSFLEWTAAAVVVAAVALLGARAVREIRTVNAVTPVIAGDQRPDPAVPVGVPSRAVSVPILLLPGGLVARLGDRLDLVATRLAAASETRSQSVERVGSGERLTRFYEYAGARFVLVFEPFGQDDEPRIAAIYMVP